MKKLFLMGVSFSLIFFFSCKKDNRTKPPSYSVKGLAYYKTDSLSVARSHLAAAALGGKMFFAGGATESGVTDVVDIFDVTTEKWTQAKLSEARSDLAATAMGNHVFFAGGSSATGYSRRIDIYDVTTGQWGQANLSLARTGLVALSDGSRVYFAGGNINGQPSSLIDVYDPLTRTLTSTNLSEPRAYFAGCTVDGRLYFFGGQSSFLNVSRKVDIFNPGQNIWGSSQMSSARWSGLAAAADSFAIIAGGREVNSSDHSNKIDVFNTKTSLWQLMNMKNGRSVFAGGFLSGRLIVAGGVTNNGYTNSIESYDFTNKRWETLNYTLSEARSNLSATVSGNMMAFAGGYRGRVFKTVELIRYQQ